MKNAKEIQSIIADAEAIIRNAIDILNLHGIQVDTVIIEGEPCQTAVDLRTHCMAPRFDDKHSTFEEWRQAAHLALAYKNASEECLGGEEEERNLFDDGVDPYEAAEDAIEEY